MNLLPELQTLSEWLRIATWKLAGPAQERIRLEIETHYAQSVEVHRGNGLSEIDARAAALADLGDPEAAAKRFRKRHLTESEAAKLKRWYEQAGSRWVLLCAYLAFCFFRTDRLPIGRAALASHNSLALYWATAFFVAIIPPTACFLAAKYSRVKPNGYMIFLHVSGDFLPWAFLYPFFIAQPPFGAMALFYNGFLSILFFSIPIVSSVISLRLWIKLVRMGATVPSEVS